MKLTSLLIAVVVIAACGRPETAAVAAAAPVWPPAIEEVATPAPPESGEPQLSVSDRGVIMSWIERHGDSAALRFAGRTATGWTEPRTAASGDDWFVNWADVPSVLRLANGTLAAHWLQKSSADTYAYDVRLSYSEDEGRTWAPSFTPHHDGTETEHGFASLFQMPGSGLGLVWLDGRSMGEGEHEEHGDGGAMSLRAASYDAAWDQQSEDAIDLRICECCPTAVAVTADGPIAAFRNRSDDEVRDIYVSRLRDGAWTEPAAVHDDGWRIPACPVNGPALSAAGRDVAIAWFTVKNDQGQAYLAFSSDAGRTFSPPVRLDDGGSLGRVDVELLPDGSAIAAWIEFADQRAQFRIRRVERSGVLSPPITVSGLEGSRASGYPRLAHHGNELVFAWTSTEGTSQVHTAVAHLAGTTVAVEEQ